MSAQSADNLKFIDVTFSYPSSIEAVFSSLNIHFAKGWTGIVGANGSGKSTLAKLATGLLQPTHGSVVYGASARSYYCAQSVDDPPADLTGFMQSEKSRAGKLRSLLAIDDDWPMRWATLSYGERKRLQIGVALFQDPDILALDEPINHVDNSTKRLLMASLQEYEGVGILIAHDREFLDTLCQACLFLRQGEFVLRPGNFSEGMAQQELEDESREQKYFSMLSRYRDLKKRANKLKQKESAKRGKLSKSNIARGDHDAKSRVDAARLTGKDKTGSRKAVLLERRAEKLGKDASASYFRRSRREGIIFQGEKSKRDNLLNLDLEILQLSNQKSLRLPHLHISPADRIALTGDNGTGKSSLIKAILPQLQIGREELVFIPQEIELHLWQEVERQLQNLSGKDRGLLYIAVHRLGSEPERLLYSPSPSPGEKRKIMLGLGLLKKPSCIILDEPTNHMDIHSIQCLEEALRQFQGALLIASHDLRFIKSCTGTVWSLCSEEGGAALEIIHR